MIALLDDTQAFQTYHPAEKVQLHPASVVYARPVSPCFPEVSGELWDGVRRQIRQCSMQRRRGLRGDVRQSQ